MSSIKGALLWKFCERFGVQAVQFVVSIIIARLLDPSEYGVMAIMAIFISLATTVIQSGWGAALIQRKNVTETDYSTVFYYSLTFAGVLYTVLFVSANVISEYFNQPLLDTVLKVNSLVLFIGAFNSVQIAYASRLFLFKQLFKSNIIAALLSGFIGIGLAVGGYGVWALVSQQLSYQLFVVLTLLFLVDWKPRLLFSMESVRLTMGFGSKILGANIIDRLYHNLENIIIGKNFSSATLAFFDRGKQFPLILIDNIDGSIQSVMFPAYSKLQDNPGELRETLRKAVRMSSFVSFSAMTILFVIAPQLIRLFLGEKWMDAVPFLQFYCIICMLFPLQTANLQAFNAVGKSSLYFRLTTLKRVVGTGLLLSSIFLAKENVFVIVWCCLIIEVISICLNIHPNNKYLGYRFIDLLADILPNALMVVLSIAVVAGFNEIVELNNQPCQLLANLLIGVGVIAATATLSNNASFTEVKKNIHFKHHEK